ncbi:hypothetical protein CEP49_08420 [Mergibacter septicus]|uniref:MlaA family lipoprotein n=1 Tax=Mergibacter septicus TaxID=221402 RepID=UPI001178D77F|nr:MlaA family lipoprotein [Mergibacter septicus]AWX14541.1 hypothetical protein CEP49_08420 [Mergibacter septicus]
MNKTARLYTLFIFLVSIFGLTACSSITPDNSNINNNPQLERFNRSMWNVNYYLLDPYVLRPVAQGWRNYVPSPVKIGLLNVANNLDEPASMVNRLLEGNVRLSVIHLNRFILDTVFGLGGLINWSDYVDSLKIDGERSFGDTLGYYGVGTGSYIMLPGYGAFTPRQDLGRLVDYTYPTLSLLGPWSLLKSGIQSINKRAELLEQDALLSQAQDPYITFREAYFQNLKFKVSDGKATQVTPTIQFDTKELDSID